jgi:hypothetical protein
VIANVCAARGTGSKPHEPIEPQDLRDVNLSKLKPNISRMFEYLREDGCGICIHCGALFFDPEVFALLDYAQRDGCPNDD